MGHWPSSNRTCVIARILYRPRVGRRPPRRSGGLHRAPRTIEGVERQAAHQSSFLPHPLLKDAGASRRSTAAISDPRVRVSWFLLRSGGPWRRPLVGGRRFGGPTIIGAVPVQQAPCGAALVPPDRFPRPPGSGVRPSPPAGAASHPASMTSHDNALGGSDRDRNTYLRNKVKRHPPAHFRASGNPIKENWVPACAGTSGIGLGRGLINSQPMSAFGQQQTTVDSCPSSFVRF
jgi:hypothetical protein